jgi:hypothetical protein
VKRDGPVNLTASLHQRLLNLSRQQGVDFNLLLTRFAIERLLYRLSQSRYRDEFVLKGAMLFLMWAPELKRQTHDLDLLARGDNSAERVRSVFSELCGVEAPQDGLAFDSGSIVVADIGRGEEYLGRRVRMKALLGKARIGIQVDVGFGDAVNPAPEWVDYPSLLGLPAPRLKAYARETVVAEKVHAMVTLGRTNSRLKDYYDLWQLAERFSFEGPRLIGAIRATFGRRRTATSGEPAGLSDEFATLPDKRQQWRAAVRRQRLDAGGLELIDVVRRLRVFLGPVLRAMARDEPWTARWEPGGPWLEAS